MKEDNCNGISSRKSNKQEQLNLFSGHARKMSKWSFSVCSSSRRSTRNGTDTIGTIDFDESNELMATGGIARRIRVYSLPSILPPPEAAAAAGAAGAATFDTDASAASVICMPARLSSLQWKPGQAGVIGCGDYDGVVAEWDVERRLALMERDEHDGRHVWSVNYCRDGTGLCLSASDDGTARVWASGVEGSVSVISAPRRRSICCAEFSPASRQVVALACADSNVYLHDLRRPDCAFSTLAGHHRRPVSYVRFLAEDRLVSASVDSTIKLWDVPSGGVDPVVLQTLRSHRNVKNFVGLSVRSEGGLVACGSETNQAFVYGVGGGRDNPILKHDLYAAAAPSLLSSSSGSRILIEQDRHGPALAAGRGAALVSAVCWRQKPFECTLAAANSEGVLQLISGQPPP